VNRRLNLQQKDGSPKIPSVLEKQPGDYPFLMAVWPLPVLVGFLGPNHSISPSVLWQARGLGREVLSNDRNVAEDAAKQMLTNRRDGFFCCVRNWFYYYYYYLK